MNVERRGESRRFIGMIATQYFDRAAALQRPHERQGTLFCSLRNIERANNALGVGQPKVTGVVVAICCASKFGAAKAISDATNRARYALTRRPA